MEIRFTKIQLRNFKGLAHFSAGLDAPIVTITGANHSGKTTIADAIQWVLFGRDSQGRATFDIDPTSPDGRTVHHLDNTVALTVRIDGQETCFSKTRSERWTRRRGQEEQVLDGHAITYAIDGATLTAADYDARIAEVIHPDLFRAATDPAYLPTLPADKQRALLVTMAGERTLDEVAAADPELVRVLQEIGHATPGQYRDRLRHLRTELRKEADTIPPRIAELQTIIQQAPDAGDAAQRIEALDQEAARLDDQLADVATRLSARQQAREQEQRAINGLRRQRMDIEQRTDEELGRLTRQYRNQSARARQAVADLHTRADNARQQLALYDHQRALIDKRAADFRRRWDDVERMQFRLDPSVTTCPTCGQPLPADQSEKKRQAAEAAFNARKAAMQDQLDQEAANIKAAQADLIARIKRANEELKTAEDTLPAAEQAAKEADAAAPRLPNFSDDPEWQRLSAEIDRRADALRADGTANDDDIQPLRQRRARLEQDRRHYAASLAAQQTADHCCQRIGELQSRLRDIGAQLAAHERDDQAAERLQRAAAADLEERVNALFPTVRFRMFRTLINGTEQPTCQLTVHGVPYPALSSSERINAGLEIINAIARHNHLTAPVVIDNSECCTTITPTDGQQIRLAVAPAGGLRVTRTGQEEKQPLPMFNEDFNK